ncbi:DUF2125 domain-containing protein [Yoonia sp. F2084L]|uniref:DUF2125 domain-containing protein n=1 Tax=Yoonia sp. F2084L TaxID=2926419 RepID=UPI001FF1E3C9|nr:DUF2125 domain-containing protein [Yoonia sp. F2084L]MCK0096968.1 DUF2125 domain-containing protein [Yoonia sp. F2084L]
MTNLTGMRSAVCLAALIAGSAAQADVTAAQVWEDWKSQMALYGEDGISIGAEETSSGTVTVRDLAVNYADDDVAFEMNIGDIIFNEQSDGTVRVTMADSYPFVITAEDGTVINIEVSQTNVDMIVSGDPDAMNYDVTADQYKIAFVDAVNGDVTFGGDATLTANNVTASSTSTIGETRETSYSATVDVIDMLVDFQIPGSGGEYVAAAAKYNDLSVQGEVSMPVDVEQIAPGQLVAAGMTTAGGYIIESSDFVVDVNAEDNQFAASGSTGQATFTVAMSDAAVAYDTAVDDLDLSMQSSELPLPIDINMARYGLSFEVPIAETEEPAPMGISFDLIDLTMSDGLWNLFDPGSILPRNPATIQLSLQGTVRAMLNVMDPEDQMAMAMGGGAPFEPETLVLETLNIDAAGALVTGEGAFTFDNTDMQSFAPLPRPEGEAKVEITGFNTLLDNLVAMGVVPEQDVMGARMMMGMFARSTGEDSMETAVEILPNGQVNVNGNRVR